MGWVGSGFRLHCTGGRGGRVPGGFTRGYFHLLPPGERPGAHRFKIAEAWHLAYGIRRRSYGAVSVKLRLPRSLDLSVT